MSHPIKKVISQVYELEGLLLLIQNHGANTDQFIYDMVREKSKTIAELVETLSPEIFNNKIEQTTTETNDESSIEEGTEQEVPINISQFDDIMLGSDNSFELEDEIEYIEDTPAEEEIVEDEDIEIEIIYEEIEDKTTETTEDKPVEITEETTANNSEVINDIAHQLAKGVSIRKAFSLNDRFRFKRELFENSDIVMNNTLDLVDAMSSFTEAEEYFYNDLHWDKESIEVIDFMFIIRNHF